MHDTGGGWLQLLMKVAWHACAQPSAIHKAVRGLTFMMRYTKEGQSANPSNSQRQQPT